ncbi:hypothetical protein FA13DRAFT_1712414 [Coprinellus micaceus]|uniref:Uncharacterized protein n=1 Tax=Coprinellus micaceus TaxID=71717 RepID=A0A4Y7T177_COPMI|nr:hypothetical protein FA13DRAFT_1712414 [Coprinellus micaceus]
MSVAEGAYVAQPLQFDVARGIAGFARLARTGVLTHDIQWALKRSQEPLLPEPIRRRGNNSVPIPPAMAADLLKESWFCAYGPYVRRLGGDDNALNLTNILKPILADPLHLSPRGLPSLDRWNQVLLVLIYAFYVGGVVIVIVLATLSLAKRQASSNLEPGESTGCYDIGAPPLLAGIWYGLVSDISLCVSIRVCGGIRLGLAPERKNHTEDTDQTRQGFIPILCPHTRFTCLHEPSL